MNEEHPKRIVQLDPEIVLKMKTIGFSLETMAAYYGMSHAKFLKEVEKVPLLGKALA